jgi:hypothetical protein
VLAAAVPLIFVTETEAGALPTVKVFVLVSSAAPISPSAFASFVTESSGVRVQFNTGSIGYSLETDDEVIAIGKFQ